MWTVDGCTADMSATICFTFDNLGHAADVGRGLRARPDDAEPGLAVGLPRILRLLDEVNVRATFFTEGWAALHHRRVMADLLERGHELALHGWVHERWSELGAHDQERLLVDGAEVLRQAGEPHPGFRAPGGVLAPQTAGLLADLGFSYDSSLLDADDDPPTGLRTLPGGLVNVPWRWEMVDHWQYHMRPVALTPAQLTACWLDLVDAAVESDGLVTFIAHPRTSGLSDERFAAFERVVRRVVDDGRIVTGPVRDVVPRARHRDVRS
jgi:peptidoglycan-N-acetylglucosamine deacetylase